MPETSPDIAVIGFGYIGSVIAAVLAGRGFSVVGIDTNARMIAEVQAGRCPIPEPGLEALVGQGVASGRLTASTDPAAARGARAVLVTVGTPLSEDYAADLAHIRAACASVAPHLSDGQIVMIKSTVPPGTTRAMHDEIIAPALPAGARVHMAFSPERLAEGAAIRELTEIPILVGGIDAAAGEAAAAFWREVLPVEVMRVASPEAAEMVKLADNLWIDLNIALANELAKLVDALPFPIDVMEVIRGANTLRKGQHHVNILYPANGVGGYCLTKDPWFVDALGRRAGVELLIPRASRAVNDSMPGHVFDRVTGALSQRGIAPREAKVALLGFSFKSNSGDTRFSPVAPLVEKLRAAGCALAICDPMVTAAEARHHGIDLVPGWQEAVAGADAVLILAGHDAFAAITPQDFARLAPGALIYDGRIYYPRARIAELEAAGLGYMGVGR
jgi:UDP-N-acetyl-D-mannosaminuronic acid dehydrogenase